MITRNLILIAAAGESPISETTKVVLLGTGTPNPEPDRSGPAVAIVVNDTPYLILTPWVASRAQPKLLVLYHVLFWGSSEETVLEEVREKYSGAVVQGHDLDVY